MIQTIEQLPSATILQEVYKNLNGKKISEANDLEIRKTLIKIYFLIGLRPAHYPTKEQDAFLIDYLYRNFAQKTLDELYHAFDLAVKNELLIDDWKVYDNFSPEYLMRIMTAYRQWLKKLNSNIKTINENQTMPEITKQEKLAEIEEYKSKQTSVKLLPIYLYDWCYDFGMIRPSVEEKKEFLEKAERYNVESMKADGVRKIIKDESYKQKNINLAKKMIVYNYLYANKKN